ncbi:MAG: hypothetical protein MZV49_17120 [Rhodopseudomonas palustris]|nr:hypothetical protein [Rhodopseudomonas palustris]
MKKQAPTACRSSWSTCSRRSGNGLTVRPIRNMVNHETNELFFDNLRDPGREPDRRGRQGLPATSSTA